MHLEIRSVCERSVDSVFASFEVVDYKQSGCVQSSGVANRSEQSSSRVCLCMKDERFNIDKHISDDIISSFPVYSLQRPANLNFPDIF